MPTHSTYPGNDRSQKWIYKGRHLNWAPESQSTQSTLAPATQAHFTVTTVNGQKGEGAQVAIAFPNPAA